MGDAIEVSLSEHFSDPDGDPLSYLAESSDSATATVSVSGDTLEVAGMSQGSAAVTVVASDPGGLSAEQSFTVTVPNRAPEPSDSISDAEVFVGDAIEVSLSEHFSDPDGDPLSYLAESSDSATATVSVSGDTLEVAGMSQGSAAVTVVASDPGGLSAEQSFTVTVPNRAPEPSDSIPDSEVSVGAAIEVSLSEHFSDPDGDELSYGAESSDGGVVAVSVSGDTLQVTGVAKGSAIVTVTATDPEGLSAEESFEANVVYTTRQVLEAFYHAAGGDGWRYRRNWLSDRDPRNWHGIDYDNDGIASISLITNNMSGTLTPLLGELTNLKALNFLINNLRGGIPPELGELRKLEGLTLARNPIGGSIPPELGNLTELVAFNMDRTDLEGSIPPELGELPDLRHLHLDQNELTGAIPRELGDLSNLVRLSLTNNDLSGNIPSSLGRLGRLHRLEVSHNPKLTGTIPSSFTNLTELWVFYTGGTGVCGPDDSTFLDWLGGIMLLRVKICGREGLAAYLVQATQSREYPVPLVAEKQALLRVFVTATRETDEEIPPVRARFYRDGSETYTVTIPGKSVVIPTEIDESSLETSSNVTIPDTVLHPELEMVIEIDPDGTLDEDLLLTKRIPEEGRLALEVHSMPDFDLTFVPFLWEEDPDSSVLEATEAMVDDEEEHELLHDTYDLLPVEGLSVSEHDPVVSSSNVHVHLLHQTYAIRAVEGGSGYWMGLMAGKVLGGRGVALLANKVSFSVLDSWVMAHELGHNLYSLHASGCGTLPNTVDRNYPYLDGEIGAWGYNHRTRKVVQPSTSDFMSYCDPRWVSDYFFSNMTRFRANGAVIPGDPTFERRGLLVWGSVDDEGVPSLEPAVVVDAPPSGRRGPGPYTLTGKDAAGARLFSFSFDMEEVADAEEGVAQFAFVLPVEPGWAGSLESITLTAPDGSASLDGETDAPMAIIRDVRSGQVRAFLRGLSERPAPPAGFEVYWSRGIPDREEWAR